jgi:hypothetical protein
MAQTPEAQPGGIAVAVKTGLSVGNTDMASEKTYWRRKWRQLNMQSLLMRMVHQQPALFSHHCDVITAFKPQAKQPLPMTMKFRHDPQEHPGSANDPALSPGPGEYHTDKVVHRGKSPPAHTIGGEWWMSVWGGLCMCVEEREGYLPNVVLAG